MRRRVELHIDKMILHGLSPAARQRIGPAIEAEMNRLIAAHGLPRAMAEAGRVLRLPGGTYTLGAPGAGSRHADQAPRANGLGAAVAGELHRTLGGADSPDGSADGSNRGSSSGSHDGGKA